MKITSRAFSEGSIIPSKYTCEGENVTPPLSFQAVPATAKSLVLLMDDPDVPLSVRPDRMYDHWVVYNIPPTIQAFAENTRPPGIQGKNTSGQSRYTGPCPPDREHRYFFKLYALDTLLDLPAGATKKQVEQAMQGHVLETAQLMCRYEKGKGY